MAYAKMPFNPRAPLPLVLVGLLLMVPPTLVFNGIYPTHTANWVGRLACRSEDIAFASGMLMTGMVCCMGLLLRLKARFLSVHLVVAAYASLFLLTLLSFHVTSVPLLATVNWLMGVAKMMAIGEVLLPFVGMIMKKGERVHIYLILYPFSIGLGNALNWLVADWADAWGWKYAYGVNAVIFLVGIAVGLVAYGGGKRMARPKPLYDMDWIGFAQLTFVLVSLNWIFAYGKLENWFASDRITGTALAAALVAVWLCVRETRRRRPLLDFSIFRLRHVRVAMVLITIFNVLLSAGLAQSSLIAVTMKLSPMESGRLNLWMVAGIAAMTLLSIVWFQRKWSLRVYVALSFLALAANLILILPAVGTQAGPHDLHLPLFFKGVGFLGIYIGVSLLAAGRLDMLRMVACMVFFLVARSVTVPTASNALFGQWIANEQKAAATEIVGKIDALDPEFQARYAPTLRGALAQGKSYDEAQSLATAGLYATVLSQATLVAARKVFLWTAVLGVSACLLAAFIPLGLDPPKSDGT